jgi:hypothetical protein
LPKFKISITEALYYKEEEIEAENENTAKEAYLEKFNAGNVPVTGSDLTDISIKEVEPISETS